MPVIISVLDLEKSDVLPQAWAVIQLDQLSKGGEFPLYNDFCLNEIGRIEVDAKFT